MNHNSKIMNDVYTLDRTKGGEREWKPQ